jgi:hypothetical protein
MSTIIGHYHDEKMLWLTSTLLVIMFIALLKILCIYGKCTLFSLTCVDSVNNCRLTVHKTSVSEMEPQKDKEPYHFVRAGAA